MATSKKVTNKLPQKNQEDNFLRKKELLTSFFEIETKKVAVDQQREMNIAAELKASAETAKAASKVAEKDLEVIDRENDRNFRLRDKIVGKLFWLVLIVTLGFIGLFIYFGSKNQKLFEKFMTYIYDVLKIGIGGLAGYLLKTARVKKQN